MSFQIKTENFTGPLDLLLQLIENEKLDITQVSLANVADQYLKHVEEIAKQDTERAAEFLIIATQLLLIKSKVLLPEMQLSEKEEEEVIDLEARLQEYKHFKDIALKLKEIASRRERSFERQTEKTIQQFTSFYPPQKVSVDQLKLVFEEVLRRMPKEEQIGEELLEKTITLEEKMEQISRSIKSRREIYLHEVLEDSHSRLELVVTFLAILEMIKQKIIHVVQNQLFEPIKILPAEASI